MSSYETTGRGEPQGFVPVESDSNQMRKVINRFETEMGLYFYIKSVGEVVN